MINAIAITHPIAVGEIVKYKYPTCPCTGHRWGFDEGKIRSVENINQQFIYTLFTGVKVLQKNIMCII